MRVRPVRPNIYLPVVRFGVADSDWFSVLLISCAGYLAPIPFGITIFCRFSLIRAGRSTSYDFRLRPPLPLPRSARARPGRRTAHRGGD